MSDEWYYRQDERAVGPFPAAVLARLKAAGIITDNTPVKGAEANEAWRPFGEMFPGASDRHAHPGTAAEVPPEPGSAYYYLDENHQPVGPFDGATLCRLWVEAVLGPDTLVAAVGSNEWAPASILLGADGESRPSPPTTIPVGAHAETLPCYRPFERFAFLMAVTLSLFTFYVVPLQSRDMKAITGRERMEFTALMILGVVTCSLLLAVMMTLWAFDLERHGRTLNKVGRQEGLGIMVLMLNVLSLVLGFVIDSFAVAFLIGACLNATAVWRLQREINLYATLLPVTTTL